MNRILAGAALLALALLGAMLMMASPRNTVTIQAEWEGSRVPGSVADVTVNGEHFRLIVADPSLDPSVITVSLAPTYEWTMDGLWSLRSGGVSESPLISAGLQLIGDACTYVDDDYAQGDNNVDVEDFNRLKPLFGQEVPCCDERNCVDFNLDGVVGIDDFSLLRRNFGVSGHEVGR